MIWYAVKSRHFVCTKTSLKRARVNGTLLKDDFIFDFLIKTYALKCNQSAINQRIQRENCFEWMNGKIGNDSNVLRILCLPVDQCVIGSLLIDFMKMIDGDWNGLICLLKSKYFWSRIWLNCFFELKKILNFLIVFLHEIRFISNRHQNDREENTKHIKNSFSLINAKPSLPTTNRQQLQTKQLKKNLKKNRNIAVFCIDSLLKCCHYMQPK